MSVWIVLIFITHATFSFLTMMIGAMEMSFNSGLARVVFPFQYNAYQKYSDELNVVGMIILIFVITLFTLSGSIIMLVVVFGFKIFEIFREIFFVTFRREIHD